MISFRNVSFLLLSVCAGFCAQGYSQSPVESTEEKLQTRIRQLESQMESMREEMSKLKQAVGSHNNNIESTPQRAAQAGGRAEMRAATTPALMTPARQSSKPEVPKNAPGVDLGSVRAIPYGTVWFNAFSNTNGSNNADVPIFATPTGVGNISASARQTRLGLRIEGPRVWKARLTGVLEGDFFGGFPSIGIGENFGVVRLRLAYGRLDWAKTTIVAGQDWMVFAPVNPVSIVSAGIPEMAAAGNPWARLPQVRIEQKWASGLNVQGAVLAPSTGDANPTGSSFFLQPGAGGTARLPFFQSRVAVNKKNWFDLEKPGSLGASVHYGRARFSTLSDNNESDSFGLALDWNMPLTPHFTLAGESFFGRNLGGFQSAVFQGINPDYAFRKDASIIAGGPRAIGTRGGWTQLGFTPSGELDQFTLFATYGLDDPRDEDLTSITRRDWRLRNQAYAFSFVHKPVTQVSWGLEFRRLETTLQQNGKRTNNHVNLGVAVNF
jgi:hypothetical protein